MAAALFSPSVYCSSSKLRPVTLLSSSISTNPRYHLYGSVTRLGFPFLSPWNSLKRLSISFWRNYKLLEKKRKSNRMAVYASLFGIGAPEALVIGVVALLIFGPKGLAEVARNLGKTFRSFQPTIRELQEVSREFKSTFEREIGLDEVNSATKNSTNRSNLTVNESQQAVSDPNGRPVAETQELIKITEPSATTKSHADLPEEEPKEAITSNSNAAPSEGAASGPMEAKDASAPLQRRESEDDAK